MVAQRNIVVLSPPFPEGRAIVSLFVNQQQIPCEDPAKATFDYLGVQQGTRMPATASVPQNDPVTESEKATPMQSEEAAAQLEEDVLDKFLVKARTNWRLPSSTFGTTPVSSSPPRSWKTWPTALASSERDSLA
mgnify:CR=1 FL=1